jgi:hypothetical protein
MRYRILACYGRVGYGDIYWSATGEDAIASCGILEVHGYIARFEEVDRDGMV